MNFEKFIKLSDEYNVIPVFEKITADLLTPVLTYLKIREENSFCFLLESVEGIGRLARFSFIGKDPIITVSNKKNLVTVAKNGECRESIDNIFNFLKTYVHKYKYPRLDELPDFSGGLVGFIGFENISLIEDVIHFDGKDELNNPDSFFGLFNTILAFDHFSHQLIIVSNVFIEEFDNLDDAYKSGKEKITQIKNELSKQIYFSSNFKLLDDVYDQFDKNEFFDLVRNAKKNIYEGDVFQLVLSKRFKSKFSGDPLNVYRALRMINPSPYMYFMEHGDELVVIGTSPEDLIKVKERNATILPIAGTRRRGKTFQEDNELEKNLLNDPKEIAEHMMLVDLARNDLGRVCDYDTVKLTEEKKIHRFSHVMHIVSRVEGKLKENMDCIDAFKASFPAGTVSGAPKIRAIQLINEYEQLRRNIYSGAVGYIDFTGNLDMCIAIRTLFAKNDTIFWQAGAGIVADSIPELELKEIKNKSAALLSALKFAEVIDENIDD